MDRLQSLEPLVARTQVIEATQQLRRHQRGTRRARLLNEQRKSFRIEPPQHHRGAGEQVRHQDHLRDRPERPHVEKDAVAADLETKDGVARDRHQVAMPQHRRLGRAGRAAGEIEGREIVAVALRRRPVGGPRQQRLVIVAETIAGAGAADADDVPEALDLIGEPGHGRRERGVRDQCRWRRRSAAAPSIPRRSGGDRAAPARSPPT